MKYNLAIKTLTPLHIGSGAELVAEFDYVNDDQFTYILNQDAIYANELAQSGDEARLKTPAGKLIPTPSHPSLARFVRYRLSGATPKGVARLREQIKDVYDLCYLPGSSLKGAIRRAVLFWVMGILDLKVSRNDQQGKDTEADDEWEKVIFGRDPHHDLLRLLQVADSQPVADGSLIFCQATVFSPGKAAGAPIDLEALAPGTPIQTEITIDELLLQYTQESRFPDDSRQLDLLDPQWLTVLPQIIRQSTEKLLEAELATAQAWGWSEIASWYQAQLTRHRNLPQNATLIQIGWGAGWLSKTLGLIFDDDSLFAIRLDHRLGKPPDADNTWKPGRDATFPSSRRLRAKQDAAGNPVGKDPFGWVEVTFTPAGEPRDPVYWNELIEEAKADLALEWRTISFPQEELVSVPKPAPTAPLPVIKETFDQVPEVSATFEGKVYELRPDRIYLEIPGLDPNDDAIAVIYQADYPPGQTYQEGQWVSCLVIAIGEEFGISLVQCKPGP
jgi:CRISPR-associated protein Csm5